MKCKTLIRLAPAAACAAAALAWLAPVPAAAAQAPAVQTVRAEAGQVMTESGIVEGTRLEHGLRFLGIPYAQAAKRFMPASAAAPWKGVFKADRWGASSPQGIIPGFKGGPDVGTVSNNCQNLNIWTPAADGRKRAVMVWLHGGGFSIGSSSEKPYDGAALSSAGDVVVVSVNHRLSVFGFLDLADYGEKYRYSANAGMLDLVMALEWIQRNIAAFGGDPGNVTVFGQSGGGAKALALMSSPYAKGLFKRAIVQSGATETMGVAFSGRRESRALTKRILQKLGISETNVEALQSVPADKLERAAADALREVGEELSIPASLGGGYSMELGPVVEGDFLPSSPVTPAGFAPTGRDVPLLIGSNLNEWTRYFPAKPVKKSAELTAALRSAYPDHPDLAAEHVDTTTIRVPLLKIMAHKAAQNGAPVYAYLFDYGYSFHGAEIPFVFNHAHANAEESRLSAEMSAAWINFAKTGVPAAEGLPEWKPWQLGRGETMILGAHPRLAADHDRALLKALVPGLEIYKAGAKDPDPDAIADKSALKFAPGGRLERPNNIGEAYIKPLLRPEGVYNMKGTNLLTFAPGARSAWHSHGGMYVIALEGIGMYQEEGKKPQILRKGDVVQIPAGTRHWHGAAPGSWFSQLVVWDSAWKPSAGTPKSAPVTDAQYAAPAEEFTGRTASGNHAFTFAHGTARLPLSRFSGTANSVTAVPASNEAGSPAMGWVLFEPSVINRWHRHPGGQIIIVTDGVGFSQVRGKPAEILRPGDIAFCPPGEEHWHGAAEGTYFAHLAVGTNPGSGSAQWLEPVSAETYQDAQKALKEKR